MKLSLTICRDIIQSFFYQIFRGGAI